MRHPNDFSNETLIAAGAMPGAPIVSPSAIKVTSKTDAPHDDESSVDAKPVTPPDAPPGEPTEAWVGEDAAAAAASKPKKKRKKKLPASADLGTALVVAEPQAVSAVTSTGEIVQVIPADQCQICGKQGTVPHGSTTCTICGGKKKLEVVVSPKKKKEKKKAVPVRPYRTADEHDADMNNVCQTVALHSSAATPALVLLTH